METKVLQVTLLVQETLLSKVRGPIRYWVEVIVYQAFTLFQQES